MTTPDLTPPDSQPQEETNPPEPPRPDQGPPIDKGLPEPPVDNTFADKPNIEPPSPDNSQPDPPSPRCTKNNDCNQGESCQQGVCCQTNQRLCNGLCTDLNNNNNHCGQCNQRCDSTKLCKQGICCVRGQQGCCPNGEVLCNKKCVNQQNDSLHCGACNKPCNSPQPFCSAGKCTQDQAFENVKVHQIVSDKFGSLVFIGTIEAKQKNIRIGTQTRQVNFPSFFVARMNSSFQTQWIRIWQHKNSKQTAIAGMSVTTDSNAHIYFGATVGGEVVDPERPSDTYPLPPNSQPMNKNIFFGSITPNGNTILWSRYIANATSEELFSLQIMKDNLREALFATGTYKNIESLRSKIPNVFIGRFSKTNGNVEKIIPLPIDHYQNNRKVDFTSPCKGTHLAHAAGTKDLYLLGEISISGTSYQVQLPKTKRYQPKGSRQSFLYSFNYDLKPNWGTLLQVSGQLYPDGLQAQPNSIDLLFETIQPSSKLFFYLDDQKQPGPIFTSNFQGPNYHRFFVRFPNPTSSTPPTNPSYHAKEKRTFFHPKTQNQLASCSNNGLSYGLTQNNTGSVVAKFQNTAANFAAKSHRCYRPAAAWCGKLGSITTFLFFCDRIISKETIGFLHISQP